MLGINPEDKLEFVQKQVRLEADLFEDIKLLAKYESVSAVKFINSAIKTYVLNRQAILDENKKQIKDTLIAFSGEILASLSCYKSPQKEVSIQDTPKEQQEPIKNKVRRNR